MMSPMYVSATSSEHVISIQDNSEKSKLGNFLLTVELELIDKNYDAPAATQCYASQRTVCKVYMLRRTIKKKWCTNLDGHVQTVGCFPPENGA